MGADLFHNPHKSIPKNDQRIVRVALDHQEMGARKSQLNEIPSGKNDYKINHIKGS
jgi:hypothetical protein